MKPISILYTSLKSVNPDSTRAGNNRRLSLIILPLLLGGLFTVLLTACGGGGSSDDSRAGPPSISNFRAIPGDETLMLSWTNPKSDNITGFNITWFDTNNPEEVNWRILDSANALSSEADVSYTISNLDNDKDYEVTVVVLYGDSPSAESASLKRRPGVNADRDNLPDSLDNCPSVSNSEQDDADNDGIGDACDPEPNNPEPLSTMGFSDFSAIPADSSLLLSWTNLVPKGIRGLSSTFNIKWYDEDRLTSNNITLSSDAVKYTITGLTNGKDYFVSISYSYEFSGGGGGGSIPPVKRRPGVNTDGDDLPDSLDNCPSVSNSDQTDTDNDGIGNACDPEPNNPEPLSTMGFSDFSAIPADSSLLLSWTNLVPNGIRGLSSTFNIKWYDEDRLTSNNITLSSDAVKYTITGLTNGKDYFVSISYSYEFSGGGGGGSIPPVKRRPGVNADGDDLPDSLDNCPSVSNSEQDDADDDGIGDACDPEPNNPAEPTGMNDDNNRLTLSCDYAADGTLDECTTYTYNDAQQLIRTDARSDNGSLTSYDTYNYYADGQPTLEVYFDDIIEFIFESLFSYSGILPLNIIYNTDNPPPSQVIVSLEVYNEDGTFSGYDNYSYNEAGQLTRNEFNLDFGTDFGTARYIEYTYNTARQLTRDEYYPDGRTLSAYQTYNYNAAGQLTRKETYSRDDTLSLYQTYSYNAAGQLTRKEDYFSDDTLAGYYTYTYNAAGQLTQSNLYSDIFCRATVYTYGGGSRVPPNLLADNSDECFSGGGSPATNPVSDFRAIPADSSLLLSWTNPARDDITGFNITWMDTDNPEEVNWIILDSANDLLPEATVSYTISGLSNDNDYAVSVRVLYSDGALSEAVRVFRTPGPNADGDSLPDSLDDGDYDNDGYSDNIDNCPSVSNFGQDDADNDGIGDACDPEPNNPADMNDDNNRLTQFCTYAADGELDDCTDLTYNDAQQFIRSDTRSGDRSLLYYATYNYYANGRFTQEVYHNNTNGANFFLNIIDNTDNPQPSQVNISSEIYTADGLLFLSGNYSYNVAGQLTHGEFYDSDGTLSEYQTYIYNEARQLTRVEFYDSNRTLFEYEIYIYNPAGQLAREEFYHSNGTLFEYSNYTYNAAGQATQEDSYDAADTFCEATVYTYGGGSGRFPNLPADDSDECFFGGGSPGPAPEPTYPVSDFGAIPADGSLLLSWTNPARDDILEFNITWFDTNNPEEVNWIILDSANDLLPEATVSYTISGLINDNDYTVTVVVIYSDGSSAESASLNRRPGVNADGDSLPDSLDNCPSVSNSDQTDTNGDGTGDACDLAVPITPADMNGDNNRLTQRCDYEANGTLDSCFNYTYDAQQLIRAIRTEANGSLSRMITFNYFADGQPTREVYYNLSAAVVISEPLASNIIYNISGQQPTEVIFAIEVRSADNSIEYTNWTYNAAGQLIGDDTYYEDEDGSGLFGNNNFTYNPAGQLTRFDGYSGASEDFTGHTNLTYNPAGQLTGVNNYDSDGMLDSYEIYIYNAAGQVIRMNERISSNLYNTFTYNLAGQLNRADEYSLSPGDDDDAVGELSGYSIYIYGGDN